MTNYQCPSCRELLSMVNITTRTGSIGGEVVTSHDLHFECMTCPHILSMVVNVPNGTFIPHAQWYNVQPDLIKGSMGKSTRVDITEWDNRDERCTWLWISESEYIEVDPQELYQNMRENCDGKT